jgi:hypothetical protein
MAIDMIEDNELSALAPMRNGGHFKNEISSRPSIQRNKKSVTLNQFSGANGYDTSIIDSDYANFSIRSIGNPFNQDYRPQWTFDKARVTESGKNLLAQYEFNIDKITCDELKAMKLKLQNASDDWSRSWNAYSNSKVQDEVRTWVNLFKRRVTEFEDAMTTKKCAELEQKKLDEEARIKTQQAIQQSSVDAQLGLSQAELLAKQMAGKSGMSNSTKFMIIGGVVIVGVVLVSILRR